MPPRQTAADRRRAKARREAYAKKKRADKNRATALDKIAGRSMQSGDPAPSARTLNALKAERARQRGTKITVKAAQKPRVKAGTAAVRAKTRATAAASKTAARKPAPKMVSGQKVGEKKAARVEGLKKTARANRADIHAPMKRGNVPFSGAARGPSGFYEMKKKPAAKKKALPKRKRRRVGARRSKGY